MRMSLFLTICVFVCSVQAKNTNQTNLDFPSEIAFKTQLSEELNISHKIKHQVTVNYLDAETKQVLLSEKFNQVDITNNQLNLNLGQGEVSAKDFKQVISNNPQLMLSIAINGDELFPYIGLLPAGHSIETAAMASGTNSGHDGKHWKGYKAKGSISSTQAVVLSKSRPQSQGELVKTNPYEAIMIGPITSLPVSSLPLAVQQPIQPREVNSLRHENLYDKNGKRFGTTTEKVNDELAFNPVSNLLGATTPSLGVNFPGMGNINGVAPPDTEGTVGPNHFIQMVNSSFAIYNKAGTQIQAPVNINSLWSGFGGRCQSDNSGDPIALYDEQADRFILTQFAVAGNPLSVCFAIAQTSDPTGSYHLYQLQAQRFPDYYKMGVWPVASNNAYTLTTNSGQQGAYDVYALDRENMLLGNAASPAQFFQNYPNLLMPADNDGQAPPADAPALFYTMRDGGEPYFGNPASDSIDVYEMEIDWVNSANTSLTLSQSLTPANGNLTDFNWTVCGFFQSSCLPQPSGVLIDSGSWWPQQRFQYRNFGNYESLVGTWTVDVLPSGDLAAPRWFELRRDAGDTDWIMRQEGTYSPDDTHRYSPSIAMDSSGNIGLAYSVTSDSVFPSIRYTVHDVSTNTHGTMQAEATMIAGGGSEQQVNRWGDYSSMDVDPADGCTFWFTSEYIASNGNFNWSTYVGSFKVPNCSNEAIVADVTDIEVCNADPAATFNLTLSSEFNANTDMTFNGCPLGATCGFSVNPVVSPIAETDFNITGLNNLTTGDYNMTATSTDSVDSSLNAVVALSMSVSEAIAQAPNLTSPTDGAFVGSFTPMLSWDNASGGSDFIIEVDDDPGFGSIDFSGMTTNSILDIDTAPLNPESCYYWRVSPSNVCGPGASSTVFSFYTGQSTTTADLLSTDVPVPISASGTPTITSDLVISGVGTISDVNVVDLNVSHSYVSDLTVQLTSPDGTTVTLMSPRCTSTDNIDINLDDEAAPGDWPCPPTDGGVYQPSNQLSSFDGENADGTWVLTISDAFNFDGGSLNTWGLNFETSLDTGDQCIPGVDPTAVVDNFQVNEDSSNNSLDVLDNDTDPDGGLITILSVTQGDNNGVVVNNGSDVSYTPEADFCGLETFTYALNGGSIGNVEVDVTCLPDPTVANDDDLTVLEDSGTSNINVIGNDEDVDGDPINITSVGSASNGTAALNGNSIDYTPTADYCGADSFTYQVNSEGIATVNVDVTCVNDEPSMAVNSAVYVSLSDIGNPPAQNLACLFDFGPDDEDVSQAVADMNVSVVNDANSILSAIDVDNSGALSYSFTGNSGVAEVTVSLQDDGGTADGGVDTSTAYTFLVNVQDYVFRGGFELDVCQ